MRFTSEFVPDDVRHQSYWFTARRVPTHAEWTSIVAWCEREYGPTEHKVDARWSQDGLDGLYFRDEVDAAAFKLCWC